MAAVPLSRVGVTVIPESLADCPWNVVPLEEAGLLGLCQMVAWKTEGNVELEPFLSHRGTRGKTGRCADLF